MRFLALTLILAVGLVACSPQASETFDCPVTVPDQPGLVPPESHPPESSLDDSVWYGSAELWTVLFVDGSYEPRKSVWWSENFSDPGLEPSPDIAVVWHRLDESVDDITNGSVGGTNGSTPGDGLFMIAGIDPLTDGCWEVTATYKGAMLSYTWEKTSSRS